MTHTRPSCIDLTFTHQSAGKLSRYCIRYIHTHTHIYTSTPAEKTFKDKKWCTNLSFKDICIYRISEIQSPLSQFAVSWANLDSVINLLASMTHPCRYSMPKRFAHLVDNSTITLARRPLRGRTQFDIAYLVIIVYTTCCKPSHSLQLIKPILTKATHMRRSNICRPRLYTS